MTATSPGDAPASAQTRSEVVRSGPPSFAILTRTTSVDHHNELALRIACRSPFTCRGTLTLTARTATRRRGGRQTVVLARARVVLAALHTATIRPTLDRAGTRLLTHAANRRMQAKATAGSATHAVTLSASTS